MSLKKYRAKRKFVKSPEPKGLKVSKSRARIFVVQEHHAQNLHWDLRLAMGGVLKSWAVPKKPLLKPGPKRLAVQVEDHPLEYAKFSGKIPEGEYGAGLVKIWDKGKFEIIKGSYQKGHLQINFFGSKLKGEYSLILFKKEKGKIFWLFFKNKIVK